VRSSTLKRASAFEAGVKDMGLLQFVLVKD